MAIYYCKVTNISRGSGRSAVGSAAYRANEKIKNEFDGRMHNYTNKHDIAYKEIIAPDNAPWWVQSRKKLWNEVEKMEKQSNSRLAREITVALPNELNRENQIELAREYCKEAFVNNGMVADLCVHDKGDGNPHAHIMVTTRGFDEQGKWLPKSRKEYMLDKNGEKIKLPSGEWKSRKIDLNDWNTNERLEAMREQWAISANRYLPKEHRIDHRSYEKQGIDKIGMVHMGHGASALERKGFETEKGKLNREIKKSNNHLKLLNQEVEKTDREIKGIRQELHNNKQPEPQQNSAADRQSQIREPEISSKRSELVEAAKGRVDLQREYDEISEKVEQIGKGKDDIRRIDSASEDISKTSGNIKSFENSMAKLREKRQGLNIFQGKEKKAIDEEIKRYEKSKEHTINRLEKEYGIKPDQIQKKLEELQRQRGEIVDKTPSQAEASRLRSHQDTVALKYKISTLELEANPDREKITELMKKFQSSPSTPEANSQDQFKPGKWERERSLNNISRSDLEKMQKMVPGQSKVADQIKNKMATMEMHKSHNIGRSR